MRDKKCRLCGESIINIDETISFKGDKVHKKCFFAVMNNKVDEEKQKEAAAKERNNKKTKTTDNEEVKGTHQIKMPVTEEEYQEKKKVLDYISALTRAKPTAKIYKLLEDYGKKYSFTFDGIYNALYFYFEVQGNDPSGDCIGIVPYVYEDAQKYFEQIQKAEEVNNAITQEEFNNMYKKVVVKLKRKEVKRAKVIDIGGIPCERKTL